MFDKIDAKPVMTILMVAVALIVVGVGGVKVIVDADGYSFAAYLDDLKTFAIGVGALGIGRGLLGGLSNLGVAVNLPSGAVGEVDAGTGAGGVEGAVTEVEGGGPVL